MIFVAPLFPYNKTNILYLFCCNIHLIDDLLALVFTLFDMLFDLINNFISNSKLQKINKSNFNILIFLNNAPKLMSELRVATKITPLDPR